MATPVYGPEVYGLPIYSDLLWDQEVYGDGPLAEETPTLTSVFTVNAVVLRTIAPPGGFTLNAQITSVAVQHFTLDAVIKRTIYVPTTTTPMGVRSFTWRSSYDGDPTYPWTPVAGRLMVMVKAHRSSGGGAPVGWTLVSTGTTVNTLAVYKRTATGTETTVITGEGSSAYAVFELDVADPSSITVVIDGSSHSSTSPHPTPTITATQGRSALVVGLIGGEGDGPARSYTPGADWTELLDAQTAFAGQPYTWIGYQIVTPVSGSYTPTATPSVSTPYYSLSLSVSSLPQGGLTLDAEIAAIPTPTGSFTVNAVVKRTIAGSFTVNAVVFKTQPKTFTVNAVVKKSQGPVGFTVDAEKTNSILRSFTVNAIARRTIAPPGGFTLDAEIPLPRTKIFGDTFTRTSTANATLGGSQWHWIEYDSISRDVNRVKAYTDGSRLVLPNQPGDWYDSYVGFPMPVTGEAYFDFWVPAAWAGDGRPTYGLTFDPWNYTGIYVAADLGSTTQWELYQFTGNEYVFTPTPSTMYRVHAKWDGTTVRANVWKVADSEPGGWQFTEPQEFASWPAPGIHPHWPPFLDLYYFPADEDGYVDNVEIWTTESTWKGFGAFQIQAAVHRTQAKQFTLNARIAGKFTLDAQIKGLNQFRLDAVIRQPGKQGAFLLAAHISRSTFTIDAQIRSGKTFTLSAVLKKSQPKLFTLDAWLFNGTWQKSFKVDASLRRGGAGAWYTNAEIRRVETTYAKGFTLNAAMRQPGAGQFDVNARIDDGHRAGSFTINADTKGQNEKRKTFTVNAVVRLAGSGLFGVAAYIGGKGYFRVNAYIRPYFRIDAEITGPGHGLGAFTVNAQLFKGLHTASFGVGAEIWKSGTQAGRYFWLDAWIYRSSGSKQFTLEAQIRGGGRFTIDAFVRPSFTVNAYIRSNDVVIWPDEQSGGDGSTPTTGTFTSPTAEFTPGMVGSTITINGVPYTIVTVVNPTTVTVSPSIPGGQSGLPWSIEPGATDPDGNPLPPGFKSSRKYRVTITIDGDDVTGDVNWARTVFTQNAKTNPGTFELVLYGPQPYNGGETILVSLDDFRTFGGYVLQIERGYVFESDADWPVTTLRGADFNILFDKLITYNTASADDGKGSYSPYKSFAVGSLDTRIINKVFGSYVDLPAGFDYKLFVDSVGVAAPEKPWAMPTSGSPLRQVMQSLSQVTEAVWWIDPYLRLHYGSRTQVTAPFPITDGAGGISSRQLSMSEDISQLVTDGFCWGTLAYTVEGEIRVIRRKSSYFGSLGPFQYGEFRSDLHHTKYIERRIESVIDRYGEPVKRAKAVIFEPGYQAGQVADVRLSEHGIDAPLVIRSMVLTFAVSKGPTGNDFYCVPRFELAIGLDPEEPWDIYDYLPFPPYPYDDPGGWKRATDTKEECIEDNTGSGCDDEACGITDTFDRVAGNPGAGNPVVILGTSDAGIPWRGVIATGGVIEADGSRAHFVSGNLSGGFYQAGLATLPTALGDSSGYLEFEVSSISATGQASIRFIIGGGTSVHMYTGSTYHQIQTVRGSTVLNTNYVFSATTYGFRWEHTAAGTTNVRVWPLSGAEPSTWLQQATGAVGTPFNDFAIVLHASDVRSEYWVSVLDIEGVNRCSAAQFEDFNRTVTGGWGTATSGAVWTNYLLTNTTASVTGSRGRLARTTTGSALAQMRGYPTPATPASGFTFRTRFQASALNSQISTGTVSGGSMWRINFINSGGYLDLNIFGGPVLSKNDWVVSTWYNVTYQESLTGVRAKVWADGATEPDWQVEYAASVRAGSDTLYVNGNNPNVSGALIEFDYIEFDYDGKPCYVDCDDSEAQTWADHWSWWGGSGSGAFAGTGWSIVGNDATLIEPAGGNDWVNFIIRDQDAPSLFASLQAGPFMVSGVMTIPYDLVQGSGQPIAGNAFQILFNESAGFTTVASLEASIGGALGGRVLLYAPGITNADDQWPGAIGAGSWLWTMTVTSTSVSASIAGRTLAVSGSFNLSTIDAMHIIMGDGAAGTGGVGTWRMSNLTFRLSDGSTVGVDCQPVGDSSGTDPTAPGGPCADEEGETFGAVTRGWGCETLFVHGGVIELTGQAARGTLTIYNADTGDHIAEGWYNDQAGTVFRVPDGITRMIACYRNYTPEIGSDPSVPRLPDPSVRRRYS